MEADFGAEMNEYLPLRDVVLILLGRQFFVGELKPGERLMEVGLAKKLGVSRTPIREAIRKLELEGLVLMIPRRGAEVAEITEKSMRDVLEVRRALEVLAVSLSSERINSDQIEELKTAAEEFERSLTSDDVTRTAEADVHFHDIIYRSTENQRLIQLLNNLGEQMYRYRVEYLKHKEFHAQISKEHKELIYYLEAGQKEAAEGKIGVHIDKQAQVVLETIRKNKNPEKTE